MSCKDNSHKKASSLNSMELDEEIVQLRREKIEDRQRHASGILHLGAHLGQEGAYYDSLDKPVLWVEASPVIFPRLEDNLKDFPKQQAFCALLGDVDGQMRSFFISNNAEGVSSSVYQFGEYAAGDHSLWPDLQLSMTDRLLLPTISLDTLLQASACPSRPNCLIF